ncbi:hypothetical protein, partial [Serratia marcescens]|uniref:hypothetical protein n=1 Tax=Serratia marcescens TaxID=615 RepID=UPI0028141C7D
APGKSSSIIYLDNHVKINVNRNKSKKNIQTNCPNKQNIPNKSVDEVIRNQNQSKKGYKSQGRKKNKVKRRRIMQETRK